MTGVEAVSNGVMAFKEPAAKYAQLTLTIIIGILAVMLVGIAYLAPHYGVAATDPGAAGYQSVLSQFLAAVTGRAGSTGPASSRSLLCCRSPPTPPLPIFRGSHGPSRSTGICRSRLRYAADAWSSQKAFTLCNSDGDSVDDFWRSHRPPDSSLCSRRVSRLHVVAGGDGHALEAHGWHARAKEHVRQWPRSLRDRHHSSVVLVAKFTEGAWITIVLIPALMLMMRGIIHHYGSVAAETKAEGPVNTRDLCEPIVLIPIDRWNVVSEKALRFAWAISQHIRVLHVDCGEDTDSLCKNWDRLVEKPAKEAGLPVPELVVLKSPYRFIVKPIVAYALDLEKENPEGHMQSSFPK